MDRGRELETLAGFDYLVHLGLEMRAGGTAEAVRLSQHVHALDADMLRRLLMVATSYVCTAHERRAQTSEG